MSGKQAERRLRQRVKAWQTARVGSPVILTDRIRESQDTPLRLEHRLEEHRPTAPSQLREEAISHFRLSPEAEVVFRAGQIWRRLDRQIDFIVDFSDGEQIEIRWFLNLQWGTPHILSVHDLLTYVRSKNVRTEWPARTA